MDIERLEGAEYLPRTWGVVVLRESSPEETDQPDDLDESNLKEE